VPDREMVGWWHKERHPYSAARQVHHNRRVELRFMSNCMHSKLLIENSAARTSTFQISNSIRLAFRVDCALSKVEAMTEGLSRSRTVSLGKSPHIFNRLLDELSSPVASRIIQTQQQTRGQTLGGILR
jgi:hypothetical protein